MTQHEANKIKKVLRKENAVFTSTVGYYNGSELRVKVEEFIERSTFENATPILYSAKEKEKMARDKIIKVLRALEKNGLRPEYRLDQREVRNNYGTWDCRYVVFK